MKIGDKKFNTPEFEVSITMSSFEIKEIVGAIESLCYAYKRPFDKMSLPLQTIYDALKFTLEKDK